MIQVPDPFKHSKPELKQVFPLLSTPYTLQYALQLQTIRMFQLLLHVGRNLTQLLHQQPLLAAT